MIQINIADTTLRFDKSRTPDVAPHHIDDTPQEEWLPVIAANKRKDDGGGEFI